MRRRLLAWTVAILCLAPACSDATSDQTSSQLSAAVEETLSADGFHIQGSFALEGKTTEAEGDYVAPDRLLMAAADGTPGGSTTIIVGRNHFISEPDDRNSFSRWRMPCVVGIDTFIPALAIASDAQNVEGNGGVFTFEATGNEGIPIEGTARVDGDYLVELTLRYSIPRIDEAVVEHWSFSDFGAIVRIEPPPDEQVLDVSELDSNPPIVSQTGQPPPCP